GESKVLKVLIVVVLAVFQGETKVLNVLAVLVFQDVSKILNVLDLVAFLGKSMVLKILDVGVLQGESKVLKVLVLVALQGESKARRAGQCCEECVATRGSCLYDGTLRYHGDMWNGTGCEFCSCERGQVVCRNAECGRLSCQQGQEVVHLQGKCCPHCVSMTTSCVFQNVPRQVKTVCPIV
ncbi:hypothetical protein CRUP_026359, partial [Coryphaenoides rupestris]